MNKKSTSKKRPVVARTVEPVVGEFGVWLDAKKFCPMKSDNVQRFIVILESQARAEHCKTWGGMGEPETCSYYHAWGSTGWNGRGGLSVAYWMPLPKFTGQWNRGGPNECGHWDIPNPTGLRCAGLDAHKQDPVVGQPELTK